MRWVSMLAAFDWSSFSLAYTLYLPLESLYYCVVSQCAFCEALYYFLLHLLWYLLTCEWTVYCRYQRLLHRNLIYLATVADASNQTIQSSVAPPNIPLPPTVCILHATHCLVKQCFIRVNRNLSGVVYQYFCMHITIID